MGRDRDFKFGRQTDRSKCYNTDDKSSLKGAWSSHVNHLHFGGHQPYLRAAKAVVLKFCMRVGYVNSQHKYDKSPLIGA